MTINGYTVIHEGNIDSFNIGKNETLNISLSQIGGNSSDLIGAGILIIDSLNGNTIYSAIWNGSTVTTEIPVNTNYTISVDTISGYIPCKEQTYQAGYQQTRTISFKYFVAGAYIEATDGTLYTASSWTISGKTANSVILLNSSQHMRIGLMQAECNGDGSTAWTSGLDKVNQTVRGAIDALSQSTALQRRDGLENTKAVLNADSGLHDTRFIWGYTYNYHFTYGTEESYCPSLGELNILYQNRTVINNCLSTCGGQQMSGLMFSSSYAGTDNSNWEYMWSLNFSNGSISMSRSQYARAITKYEP